MIVVGINAYHGDASAVLLRDGQLVAAVEEERFRRIKHWAGFPRESIRACLAMAGVSPRSKEGAISPSRATLARISGRKMSSLCFGGPDRDLLRDRVHNAGRVQDVAHGTE